MNNNDKSKFPRPRGYASKQCQRLDCAEMFSRPSFIGLGHEIAHALDNIFDGVIDRNTWYTPNSLTTPVPNAEIFSTHIENLLRAENGVNLRAFYNLNQDSFGNTIGEGQILMPGTRQNANTINANGVSLTNPTY